MCLLKFPLSWSWQDTWCVRVGRDDASSFRPRLKTLSIEYVVNYVFVEFRRSLVSWFTRGVRRLMDFLQSDLSLLGFHVGS